MTLKARALAGIQWTTFSMILVNGLQVGQLAVLSRLLQPADFGLMAMVMVVIGFAQAFVDMGISNAVIHRQDITRDQLAGLYWLNLGSGLVLCLIVAATAPLVSAFFGEPALTGLLRLTAVAFFITGIGNQYRALFQKALRFDVLAKVEVIGAVTGSATAITAASLGCQVWSLVFGQLAYATIGNGILLSWGIAQFDRPRLHFQRAGLKPFVMFGLFQMGERSVNYLRAQIDVVVIGQMFGAESVGVYHVAKTVAMRLYSVINPVVGRVALPVMATRQNDDAALKRIFLRMVEYLCLITFPIYICLAIVAETAIRILCGAGWSGAAPVLQVLSGVCLFYAFGNPVGNLLVARGRADLGFYWNAAALPINGAGFILGAVMFGPIGIPITQVLLAFVLLAPSWYVMIRPLVAISLFEYLSCMSKPLAVAAGAAALASPFLLIGGQLSELIFCAAMGVTWFAVIRLVANDFFQLAMSLIRPSGNPTGDAKFLRERKGN